MGFRAIERDKGVQTLADSLTLRYHTTIIYWLKEIGEQLPDAPPIELTFHGIWKTPFLAFPNPYFYVSHYH
jgi:hypothetical protein